MSIPPTNGQEDDEIQPPQRPPSPPPHTTFAARGLHAPTFSAFSPRDTRIPSTQSMNHIAWSCDGKKLGAVGVDKIVRVWNPEKSIELRSATGFSGGHLDDIDYIAWNPTHPELFCTSSQKDRRIVFWDARQSRHLQQLSLKVTPLQLNYSPDGKVLLYTTPTKMMYYARYGKEGDETKETWRINDKHSLIASTAMFNHVGDGIVLTHQSEHSIRLVEFPSLAIIHAMPTHVGGCVAAALDPRGKYLATGGHDSIVNLIDIAECVCTRTITACDNDINAVSFSYDGEFIAIASAGNYIDICATETAMPLHRVPAPGASPTVAWHPSKYIIAYCGQTKPGEGAPSAWISLFGPGM